MEDQFPNSSLKLAASGPIADLSRTLPVRSWRKSGIIAFSLLNLHLSSDTPGRGPGALYRTAMNMYGQSITSAPLLSELFSNVAIVNDWLKKPAITHDLSQKAEKPCKAGKSYLNTSNNVKLLYDPL
ncbi:hypothetical protein HOLleu_41903 [Holothuria leucospilota]|uniref:Uncharacterized protein n=1 Tax=Holothuria leucospilota TaxID=206669 RepID=A0A9Q1B9X7_HOLLE|nr:hypothetical protein HOLleu_41903 [Holothuria leucospilota]